MSGTKPTQTVESVCEYLEKVSPLTACRDFGSRGDSWIFRGQQQTRASWKLSPKVGREDCFGAIFQNIREWPGEQAEQTVQNFGLLPDEILFEQWCRRAVAYRENLPDLEIDRLALAQHYGLATRLLDWSRNPLVALFFGIEDDETHDGAVHALLEPLAFPPETAIWQTIPSIVWTYEPRPIDRRMLAQAALFTLHSSPELQIDPKPIGAKMSDPKLRPEIEQIGVKLVEFVIPGFKKRDIRANLAALGMTRETLFPELEGLSEYGP